MDLNLSVIIPSYNSSETIESTVRSLMQQRSPELLREVLIVDSSDDGRTPRLLERLASERVKVLRLDKKTIPAIGRNVGAQQATGDVLAFIDSDAYAEEDWLERIAKAVLDGCSVGGGAILIPPSQKGLGIASAQYFIQFSEFMPQGQRRRTRFIPSCNLFCRRELFDAVGGFPEIRACEDVLFGEKVSATQPVFFDPAIKVCHIFRTDKKAFYANQRLLGKYILIYRRDHLKSVWMRGVWPAILWPAIVLLKGLRIVWRTPKNGGFSALGLLLQSSGLFAMGLLYWGMGFVEGRHER